MHTRDFGGPSFGVSKGVSKTLTTDVLMGAMAVLLGAVFCTGGRVSGLPSLLRHQSVNLGLRCVPFERLLSCCKPPRDTCVHVIL